METNIQEIVSEVNKLRLKSTGKWYQFEHEKFRLKAYGTWVQIFDSKTKGFRDSSPMELNTKEFKNWLTKSIEACN